MGAKVQYIYHKRFSSLNKTNSPLVENRFERARNFENETPYLNTDDNSFISKRTKAEGNLRFFKTKNQVKKVQRDLDNQIPSEQRFIAIGLGKTRSFTGKTMSFSTGNSNDVGSDLHIEPYYTTWTKRSFHNRGLFNIHEFKERRLNRIKEEEEEEEELQKENFQISIFGFCCCA